MFWINLRKYSQNIYDVLVVGGGHAGCETVHAAYRMGLSVVLVTDNVQSIGVMSCNPSFGGIGKGHLMREVDALDGLSPRLCDEAGIHFRVLNTSHGPAVWGLRAQVCRVKYKELMQEALTKSQNLEIIETKVFDLSVEGSTCTGVITQNGKISAKTVVLATGTFLGGKINIGLESFPAGRLHESPSMALAKSLRANFKISRLKTGTPPRIKLKSIDFSRTTPSLPDKSPLPFSFLNNSVKISPPDQLLCYKTETNSHVADIVRESLHLNNHVREEVVGPRYCPSIEAKVLRFGDSNHTVWLEPEGVDAELVYPQGLSCTMPRDYQQRLINSIEGLEEAEIEIPGYGVEYDFVDPQQLKLTLETRKIDNLYLAGQINGTTGYEEAAAQGIVAGINAGCRVRGVEEFVVTRSMGYIGVMLEDIVGRGVTEPYRMFTSRAEFRITLRPDNAVERITLEAMRTGVISEGRKKAAVDFCGRLEGAVKLLSKICVDSGRVSSYSSKLLSGLKCLSLPNVEADNLVDFVPGLSEFLMKDEEFDVHMMLRLKSEGLYRHAVAIQAEEINYLKKLHSIAIPSDFDFDGLTLSVETKEKMKRIRPQTIGHASQIEGITAAALMTIFYAVERNKMKINN